MDRTLVGFYPQVILRGVQVYNQEIRVTVPDTGGEKNTIQSEAKFRRLSTKILGIEGQ